MAESNVGFIDEGDGECVDDGGDDECVDDGGDDGGASSLTLPFALLLVLPPTLPLRLSPPLLSKLSFNTESGVLMRLLTSLVMLRILS